MKKIKNKFIIFIIIVIISIIWIVLLQPFLAEKERESYVVLIDWRAMLNKTILEKQKREKLTIWDTVRTIWWKSMAILEWGDGSVTRLWWNTTIDIKELHISWDLQNINVNFSLLSWKTWSNVISYLWGWSYFKEGFRDTEAAVRWTVFNLDLSKDYLYVKDHKVDLTTSDWKTITVSSENPFDISNFKFLDLEEFLRNIKDRAWEELNTKIDKDLFEWLKKQIHNDLDELVKFEKVDLKKALQDEEYRKAKYEELLTEYQKLNFVKSSDWNLFETKMKMKEKLLALSTGEEKNRLVENTLYDLKDVLKSKDNTSINMVMWVLSENKDVLQNIDLKKYVDIDMIPEWLKESMFRNFWELKWIFMKNLNMDSFDNIKDLENKAKNVIQDGLDSLFNK